MFNINKEAVYLGCIGILWPINTLRKRKEKLGAIDTRERLEFQKVWTKKTMSLVIDPAGVCLVSIGNNLH